VKTCHGGGSRSRSPVQGLSDLTSRTCPPCGPAHPRHPTLCATLFRFTSSLISASFNLRRRDADSVPPRSIRVNPDSENILVLSRLFRSDLLAPSLYLRGLFPYRVDHSLALSCLGCRLSALPRNPTQEVLSLSESSLAFRIKY